MDQAIRTNPARTVLFDMDGTLGPTLDCLIGGQQRAAASVLGRPVSREEVCRGFGLSEPGAMQILLGGRAEEGFRRYDAEIERVHAVECPAPFPGIPRLLSALRDRGLPLGLISGRCRETLDITLRQFGLAACFSYIGAGDPTHEVKDLRAKEALLQFGLTPADAVYVGDMTSDVRFAKRLGMRAVAVSYASYSGREALREAGPDALCDSVDELEHTLLSML